MSDLYVADRIALMDVMANYARGVDQRDMNLYRSCFTDDVEVLGFGGEMIRGADRWTEYVDEALKAYGSTQHLLGPQLATIDGDTAQTQTQVQALHFLADAPDTTLTLWATYHTEFRRIDTEWKIVRHRLEVHGTRTQKD